MSGSTLGFVVGFVGKADLAVTLLAFYLFDRRSVTEAFVEALCQGS